MPNSLIISAPGKLFISGEWAVLEPKNPAIVVAVKKRIFAKISDSQDKKIHLSLKNYCLKDIEAEFQKNRLRFVKKLKPEEEKNCNLKTVLPSSFIYLIFFLKRV